MILLDTHIWIWWVDRNPRLTPNHQIIVATVHVLNLPLFSLDEKIVQYPHVSIISV
jgi:PIN domain nuclease of toxin-antitoxin system